ncbi:putative MSEP-CTERM sorting domain-containing protein [Gammaproteobacteria bacterium]
MNLPTETRTDIPPFLRSSYLLLWGYVLPQAALVILNLRGWWLIADEVNLEQQAAVLHLFVVECLILGLNGALFVRYKGHNRFPGWGMGLALFLIHAAYLWGVVATLPMVPRNVPRWIIEDTDFLGWNFTLWMPGTFLALYLMASVPSRLADRRDALYSVLAMLAIPLAWYVLISMSQPVLLVRLPQVVTILLGVVSVVLMLVALVRLINTLMRLTRHGGRRMHTLLVLLLGLVAPLIGLYLNRSIAFPADFQSTGVYVLTVLNGLLLLAPSGGPHTRLQLFMRALTYPFILYFFLVFLPFLPLSLLATLAMGMGFLMLVPLALGVFQTGLLVEDFRAVQGTFGRVQSLGLLLTGVLWIPGYLLMEAVLDRVALHQAIDVVYNEAPSPSPVQATRATRALMKLHAYKQGIQLPYLASAYSQLVFGGMVLSDDRIGRMYYLLSGTPLPTIRPDSLSPFFYRERRIQGRRGSLPPRRDIALESIESSLIAPGQARVHLKLRNQSADSHSEYLAHIKLPEGVFATGLTLKIEDRWEQGKVFDRKTALWVYTKSTEVKRDPSLLLYSAPDTLELRVYPFPAEGQREVAVDFRFPVQAAARISLDGREVVLNPDINPDAAVNTSLQVAGEHLAVLGQLSLPTVIRRPYLHIMLDFSVGSEKALASYPQRIARLAETLGIREVRLSAINLYQQDLDNGVVLSATDQEALSTAIKNARLPPVGGFWGEQAIRRALLHHADGLARGDIERVPLFVLLAASTMHQQEWAAMQLSPLASITPDVGIWYLDERGTLSAHSFTGEAFSAAVPPVLSPVHIFRRGATTAVINPRQPAMARLPGNAPLAYFDGAIFSQVPESVLLHPDTTWLPYAELWSTWRTAALDPAAMESRRGQLLEASRSLGMLIPSTSLMVVENTAQWRILERKEDQSLANQGALAFEERKTPEPPEWIMLVVLIVLIAWGVLSRRFPAHDLSVRLK